MFSSFYYPRQENENKDVRKVSFCEDVGVNKSRIVPNQTNKAACLNAVESFHGPSLYYESLKIFAIVHHSGENIYKKK